MLTFDEIIEFENENTWLDFKLQEYSKGEYVDLIKDVMSMANAPMEETKYIIFGVKDIPGESRQFIGIDSLMDQANIENVIQENIEPIIKFRYYPHVFGNVTLGVLEILDNRNPPYMMKKSYAGLQKGEIWIRKGTRQSRATREDLDRMEIYKNNNIFSGNLKLGFNDLLEESISLVVPSIEPQDIPSNKAKTRYENQLAQLKKHMKEEKKIQDDISNPLSALGKMFIFQEYKSDTKEIRVGYSQFGLPIYKNEETLQKNIDNVGNIYSEEDNYFFFEEKSIKLNFFLLNESNIFLEDVSIKLWFRRDVFMISDTLPTKPNKNNDIFTMHSPIINYHSISSYPDVTKESKNYLIEEHFANIRHKEITKLFEEDLRVLVLRDTLDKEYEISYRISARNLYDPLNGTLRVFLRDN